VILEAMVKRSVEVKGWVQKKRVGTGLRQTTFVNPQLILENDNDILLDTGAARTRLNRIGAKTKLNTFMRI
jgi:hypothetical protein